MKLKIAALSSVYFVFAAAGAYAAVGEAKVERIDAGKVAVTWSGRGPVDVYLAERPDAALSSAKLVSDDNKSGRFDFTVGETARPYILLKDEQDGTIAEVAERALPLEQGSNFRDLGGYPAAGNKHVRWGLVFRSGGTPMLTEGDLARIRALGLTDMVDLRSAEERVVAPSKIEDVRYTAVGYSMSRMMRGAIDPQRLGDIYRDFPTLLAPQMRTLFKVLLEEDTTVAYNCSAGQDRTGFATALLLTALGVPRETIIADYHLSTTYRRPAFETPKLDPNQATPALKYIAGFQKDPRAATPQPLYDATHKPFLNAAFEQIEARWGSVEAYLDREIGVDAADIATLRAKYLE